MKNRNAGQNRFEKYIFLISILFLTIFLSYSVGYVSGFKKLWPTETFRDVKRAISQVADSWGWHRPFTLVWRPSHASNNRIFVSSTTPPEPGYLAIMGYVASTQKYAIWLLDDKGNNIHQWHIDYDLYDTDSNPGSDDPHGLYLLPDGSALINFDTANRLVRIDNCGNVIWSKEGVYHHQIDRAPDGTFWTWRGENNAKAQYNYLVNIDSEDGRTIEEISLIDDVIKQSEENAAAFGIDLSYNFRHFEGYVSPEDDLFHPNDIEVLDDSTANLFPGFNPGDIMVSFRNINAVVIFDPASKEVKWSGYGPWYRQHDPDFTNSGTITVFDNNKFGQSRIIEVNPNTGRWRNKFSSKKVKFYTEVMGTHQNLPRGNTLITVPNEGRVIEVDPQGNIVLEFNNIVSDKLNGVVANSQRLPLDYFYSNLLCKE